MHLNMISILFGIPGSFNRSHTSFKGRTHMRTFTLAGCIVTALISNGCHLPMESTSVDIVQTDGTLCSIAPQELCGRAITIGMNREAVHSKLSHASYFEENRSDYYLFQTKTPYFHFMDIEHGVIGIDQHSHGYMFKILYDENWKVSECRLLNR